MEVAPEKARQRRGTRGYIGGPKTPATPALMGRELPPAEVLAADQRITAWARELRAAGLDGRAARGDPRHRPGRPRSGPRAGGRHRAEPEHQLVRDRHRPA